MLYFEYFEYDFYHRPEIVEGVPIVGEADVNYVSSKVILHLRICENL